MSLAAWIFLTVCTVVNVAGSILNIQALMLRRRRRVSRVETSKH